MDMHPLTNLSLFSGAGGLDLGARIAGGIRTVCYVENNPYAQCSLLSAMRRGTIDDAPIFQDIRTFIGRRLRGSIDIVSGGFPCQPFSTAGKREAGDAEDNLWPEFRRVIEGVQPLYVLAENVTGIVATGYIFNVLADIEKEGYCATPYRISACAVGAPHPRSRVFIVAHSKSIARQKKNKDPFGTSKREKSRRIIFENWEKISSPSREMDTSFILGSPDGVAYRSHRLRLCGNGVVPLASVPAWEKIKELANG